MKPYGVREQDQARYVAATSICKRGTGFMLHCSMFSCLSVHVTKKSKPKATIPKPNFPSHHPEAVAMLADAMPWKTTARNFPVEEYIGAISKLHARGYSYADIANFLNEKLADRLEGKKITRGQVYRVYQQNLELNDPFNGGFGVTNIPDEVAEAKAEIEDKKPAVPPGEKKP